MIKYAVIEQVKTVGKVNYSIPRIVVKDEWDCIIGFTEFDKYIIRGGKRIKGSSSTVEFMAAKYIVMLLNYLCSCGKALSEVTVSDLQRFLDSYCGGHETGKYPGLESVNNCRKYITSFVAELARQGKLKHIEESDLYIEKQSYNAKQKKGEKRLVNKLQIHSFSGDTVSRFNDLPGRSLFDLIELSSRYDPMLTLGICSGAWAGLRVGEIVNMRSLTSVKGPGLLFERANNNTQAIKIDITAETLLTKTQNKTGRIKRPSWQRVLPE